MVQVCTCQSQTFRGVAFLGHTVYGLSKVGFWVCAIVFFAQVGVVIIVMRYRMMLPVVRQIACKNVQVQMPDRLR